MDEINYQLLSREYHSLLSAIPDTLLVISPEMEILWINNPELLKKLNDKNFTNKKCYTLFYNRFTHCDKCPGVKSFFSGKMEKADININNKFLHIRSVPIKDENENIIKVMVIVNDITEKVVFEKEATRTAHLASLGELSARIAHEINNPVMGIINYGKLLFYNSKEDAKERYIAKNIIEEGDRIANLIKCLLPFARGGKEEKISVYINDILNSSLSLAGLQMKKDNIIAGLNMPDYLPKVIAQSNQLQQVFMNILNNAIYGLNKKYPINDENKKILITAKEVFHDDKNHIRIIFRDTGCGIKQDIIDKVMEPFFSTKPIGAGTGLGLSISYDIIKEHGGTISIDSVENEYTEVTIELPAMTGGKE